MSFRNRPSDRKRSDYARVFLAYTLLFFILFFSCFGVYLLLYKKSFFRSFDGFDQHYMGFSYLGRWGRSIVRTLLTEHRLIIPLWNPGIGYGADIPTSLAAYFWDPFNWISFFVPARLTEYAFDFVIAAKVYTTGAAFLLFARHRRFQGYAALCGAIAYTFSCVSFVVFNQSFFINPMYLFPLLIIGADLLFDKKDPRLYTLMLAFSLISYFYFAYMMCIFVLLYCLVRVFTEHLIPGELPRVLKTAGRFLVWSALGFCLSAFHLLPVLLVMANAGRLGLEHYLPLFYTRGYYQGIFLGFLTFDDMLQRDNTYGFGAISLLCVFVVFTLPWKKRRQGSPILNRLRNEFLFLTTGLCIPMFGHVMNGFNYVANRWIWAYGLVIASMVCIAVDRLRTLSRKQLAAVVSCVALYLLTGFLYFRTRSHHFMACSVVLLLCTAAFLLARRFSEKAFRAVTLCLLCAALTVNAHFVYGINHNNIGNHQNCFTFQTAAGTAYDTSMNANGLPLLNQVDTSDGTRFDKYGLPAVKNTEWLYGVSGMDFYVSIYNDYIDRFHNSLAMNTSPSTYSYSGLDRRSELEMLMGVGHYFTRADNPVRPVGYSEPEAEASVLLNRKESGPMQVRSYRSDTPASLFYLFDSAVSYEDYQALTPLEKQQLLMKAVVVEEETLFAAVSAFSLTPTDLSWQTESMSGMSVDGTTYTVTEAEGQLVLKPDTPIKANSGEIYVYFDDITYANGDRQTYSVLAEGLCDGQSDPACRDAFGGSTYYSAVYGGKTHWLLNLGNPESDVDRIQLTFQAPGTYCIGRISIVFRPYEDILKSNASLIRAADNIAVGTNRYSCDVTCDSDSWLFLSVPYSTGWKATGNGQPLEIFRADDAFMAVRLTPGDHHIEYHYLTPGFIPGLSATAAGLLLFLGLLHFQKKRETRN